MAVYLDELVTQYGMGDMLNVARKKNVYGKLVQSSFGSTMPKGMTARSFDCVIMCGGFAAGHIPLSSLHTMARLCKEGGFIINSMTKQYADFVDQAKKRMSTKEGATTEIWKEMVYDKDISNEKVNAAYSVWAEAYDKDFAIVHPNRAKHMADFLLELVEGAGMRKEDLTILDVAAGTGLVGEELKKVGFDVDNVTALDLCPDMLEVSRKKKVYGKLVQSGFGTTIPHG